MATEKKQPLALLNKLSKIIEIVFKADYVKEGKNNFIKKGYWTKPQLQRIFTEANLKLAKDNKCGPLLFTQIKTENVEKTNTGYRANLHYELIDSDTGDIKEYSLVGVYNTGSLGNEGFTLQAVYSYFYRQILSDILMIGESKDLEGDFTPNVPKPPQIGAPPAPIKPNMANATVPPLPPSVTPQAPVAPQPTTPPVAPKPPAPTPLPAGPVVTPPPSTVSQPQTQEVSDFKAAINSILFTSKVQEDPTKMTRVATLTSLYGADLGVITDPTIQKELLSWLK